jgi:hypothetical protein
MKKTIGVIAISLILFSQLMISVLAMTKEDSDNDLSLFKSVYEVSVPKLNVATPVKVDLNGDQRFGVLVLEGDEVQPTIIKKNNEEIEATVENISEIKGNKNALVDNRYDSSLEFDLDKDGGEAYVVIEFEEEIKTSNLKLDLDDHVALPYVIEIMVEQRGKWVTALSEIKPLSTVIEFPERTAKKWKVNMKHSQPLRLREMGFLNESKVKVSNTEVYWLARPGEEYTLFTDAVAYFSVKFSETGNLLTDPEELVTATLSRKQENSFFEEPDDDDDGIANYRDNCVNVFNSEQIDVNENGRGDACDDYDKDRILNINDNCPEHANSNQRDTDGDNIGDECDDEESRITEKNPWIPWVAMGFVGIVVFGLMIHALSKDKESKNE